MNILIEDIEIQVQRKWVKSLRLVVKPDGTVRLTVPMMLSDAEAQRFVHSHLDRIRHWRQQALTARPDGPTQSAISREEAADLMDYLQRRVEYWRQQMGERDVVWTVRRMSSCWGSCRPRVVPARLTFNLLLARVPEELREYVIVHELAHLQHPNHGPAFHQWLGHFLPNERQLSRQLAQYRRLV